MDKEHEKDNSNQLSKRQWKQFHEETKLFNSMVSCRFYCRCGHTVIITPSQDRAMCDWCKRWVYSDPVEQQKHDEITREREKLMNFKKEMRRYL